MAYADQNERDHAALARTVRKKLVKAVLRRGVTDDVEPGAARSLRRADAIAAA